MGASALVLTAVVLLTLPSQHGVPKAAGRARATVLAKRPSNRRLRIRVATVTDPLPPVRVEATIGANAPTIKIPASFLGVSTEYWALPLLERHPLALTRMLSLFEVPGDGPLVLRIGGDSADHSFWDPSTGRSPRWVFRLTRPWLAQTALLVRRLSAKVILDLNLVTDTPFKAVGWASAAQAGLPRGSLAAFEIGNEPDFYDRDYWRAMTARRWLGAALVPAAISAASYDADYLAYSRLLHALAPHVPLAGPALGNSVRDSSWIVRLLESPRPDLATVTGHWYPYSDCAAPGTASYPTIGRLLGDSAARMAAAIEPVVRLVHRDGLRFRLTEVNSVSCGGKPGVSNTFATALWAPQSLMELAHVGVDGVNVHIRVHTINAPFALTARGLRARPLMYGLALFARTLGPDSRLVGVRVSGERDDGVQVWAVRVRGDQLHVLAIDMGGRSARVQLRLPARAPAAVQRLQAPSVAAVSGVTLDGQQLGLDGRWQGSPNTQSIRSTARGYELALPSDSAALVTVHVA